MSIKTIDEALDFLPEARTENAEKTGFVGYLMAVFAAIGDGFAAARDYETLVGRGVPADQAVKLVFAAHFESR
jgi:hypothetical protein